MRKFTYGSALCSLLALAGNCWATGEEFTAGPPQVPTWTCSSLALTSAFFQDGKPDRSYKFSGTCIVKLKVGGVDVPFTLPVKEVGASYSRSTKKVQEVVTVEWGKKDYVITSWSTCASDPYVIKGTSCTLDSKNVPIPNVMISNADFPMARGLTSEAEAKAKSPQPQPYKANILAPNPEQKFSGLGVTLAAKMDGGNIQANTGCCEAEFQNSSGGNWQPFKTISDAGISKPGGIQLDRLWFKTAGTSKMRVRVRLIKQNDYDIAPWSDWVNFWVEFPLDQPVTDIPKPSQTIPPNIAQGNPGTASAPNVPIKPGTTVTPTNIDLAPLPICPTGWIKQNTGNSKVLACVPEKPFMACPAGSQYSIESGPIISCK